MKKVVRWVQGAPVERPWLDWNHSIALGGDLLGFYHSSQPGGAKFIRVPPAASQRLVDQWSIPQLPFTALLFTVYSPENLLALVEQRGR